MPDAKNIDIYVVPMFTLGMNIIISKESFDLFETSQVCLLVQLIGIGRKFSL